MVASPIQRACQGVSADVTGQDRPLKGAWGMTALIFLFMLINFADKVVVGLAAQPIMAELNLTPEQFGLIGSSFFFLFALSAVIVGFITNRVQTRHTLLVMAIVWSLVQFPMLGTVSLEVLIACRIVLGAGEGPAAPVATHAIYKWFPDSLRGLPTAIIAQGSALGVIIAVPALNWIIVNYSWHWAFGALGIVGLLWAVLWLIFGREGTLVDPPVRTRGAAAASACPTATCSPAPASWPPAARASPATGAWRWASPGSPPIWWAGWATARSSAAISASCPGSSACSSCWAAASSRSA